jgi:hypothetical protein
MPARAVPVSGRCNQPASGRSSGPNHVEDAVMHSHTPYSGILWTAAVAYRAQITARRTRPLGLLNYFVCFIDSARSLLNSEMLLHSYDSVMLQVKARADWYTRLVALRASPSCGRRESARHHGASPDERSRHLPSSAVSIQSAPVVVLHPAMRRRSSRLVTTYFAKPPSGRARKLSSGRPTHRPPAPDSFRSRPSDSVTPTVADTVERLVADEGNAARITTRTSCVTQASPDTRFAIRHADVAGGDWRTQGNCPDFWPKAATAASPVPVVLLQFLR